VSSLNPLIREHCLGCHSGAEASAGIRFQEDMTRPQFLAQPALISRMAKAVDHNQMPPESEPPLEARSRAILLAALKSLLRDATQGQVRPAPPARRLNRFQYNNSVKDLFQLRQNVFELPETLMTRTSDYLARPGQTMPDQVDVECQSLKPSPGLRDVKAFPKDLRAEHGYDNQANQLTLSPLLLDTFLRLSVSIVESPDFQEQNVGIWNDFFRPPADGSDLPVEMRRRIEPFLMLAFRGPVEAETVDRYTTYGASRLQKGLSFTDSMKKVASAALSSPRFLYRTASTDPSGRSRDLAESLAFFLWGSGPDRELLRLAESGELLQPDVLTRNVDRMLADPRIERFLDAFPAQWLQLENVLAATPDPELHPYFRLDPERPASLHMVLEPLLLFDAVFVENRPIAELIVPTFGYQSDFLKTWYESRLQPPDLDVEQVLTMNRQNAKQRRELDTQLQAAQRQLDALVEPVRAQLLAARRKDPGEPLPVDLKPFAVWDFNGDLTESMHGLYLTAHGAIRFQDGHVVLEKAYLQSAGLPLELRAKSLEVSFQLANLDQPGGGVMGIQGPGDFFDTIVIGERKPRHWISGSNGFRRTEDFPESMPETKVGERIHLTMVYAEDGTTTLYRDGQPYGRPYRKDRVTFPREQSSVLFGLRHLPAGGNRFLNVSIDQARLYERALTAEEVQLAARGVGTAVSPEDLRQAMTPGQREALAEWTGKRDRARHARQQVPADQDPVALQRDLQRRYQDQLRQQLRSTTFRRMASADPRFGGVVTSAAMLTMNSGPKRTHPIARGAWVVSVILNDPPPPPPNDVPPLNEEDLKQDQTIREKFAAHRSNPTCAGCHARLDPLGFALENFDITGRWRDRYDNGKSVDASGVLFRTHSFATVVHFKQALAAESERFARAFTAHVLRFAQARELDPADTLVIDAILDKTRGEGFRLKSIVREVVLTGLAASATP